MKKFWNLMLAALVIMGAVACTENENVEAQPEQKSGLSFEATIDLGETRTDVVFNEGKEKWETVWTGNETLTVKHGYASFYQFKNSVEDKNHFVCTDNNAENLIGQSVEIFLTHDAEYNTLNSKAGKAGGNIEAKVDSFDPAKGVTLEVKSAFLRYSSEYEVTLDASAYIFDYNGQVRNTITLPAGEDVWVAIKSAEDVTLSYSINGEKCKEKDLNLEAKKIYNLGTLAPAAPQYKIYVYKYKNTWTNVNLYTWDSDGNYPTGAWPGSTTTATETINGYEYMVWTMPNTATGKNLSAILNNGTAQTGDFALGTLDKDCYLLLYGTDISFIEDKENPEPKAQQSEWALAGEFNSWGDTVMYTTDVNDLFVAKGVQIAAYTKIKIKKAGDVNWTVSYGAGTNYLNSNIWAKLADGGSDIFIVNAGKYDVYFDKANMRIYMMNEGVDYTTATEQKSNGAAPDLSGASWGLCGAHNGWGTNDTKLTWDGTIGLYVAKNAKLTGEFKVRANNSWSQNYGSGSTITVDNATGTTVYDNGGNCKVTSGTYDVYFDLNGKKIWVKTPGSAAPTK